MTAFRSVAAAVAVAVLAPLAIAPIVQTAQAQGEDSVLRVVKHSSLRVLDPILTTAYMSRNHGYMIYDTLFAMDENLEIQPQMVETWSVSDDQLTYSFTLRDGLMFHDGNLVTTTDVIASLERWGERDGMGQKLMDFVASMAVVDDQTFTMTLSEPYGLVLASLGKISSNVPFIMPARLAATPSTEAVPEQIGSGPFVFVEDEFEPGVIAVYEKFDDYVPREEPASWAAGGKVPHVDRVEWVTMPDHQTAMNALIAGEIDYFEQPPHDLVPIMEASPGVEVSVINKLGGQGMLRMNHLHPPFDNPLIRQAVMHAVNQEDYMLAMVGNPDYYQVCGAMYICGTPLATEAGSEPLLSAQSDRARELLEEAGYDGTPIVMMHPTDVASLSPWAPVSAQALRDAGFEVDMQAMDWQAVVSRRASKETPDSGGWNMFHTWWVGSDVLNPTITLGLNAKGADGGWFGWPEDAALEALRDEYALETDAAEQKRIAEEIQVRAYEVVTHLPLGQFFQPTAYRDSLTGIIEAPAPFFWNIQKN